ncbi:MAG: ABC transporter ATP-binding protein [Clostridia bacterium]|nr:ABC transporter ATP-binding protein [Clostridia bacterium]
MKQTKKQGHILLDIRSFSKYYKPYLWIMAFDLLCACLSTICELVLPVIVRKITNTAGLGNSGLLLDTVLKLGLLYLFLRVVDTFANYYMANTGHVMGARIETDMRRDLFAHLMKLDFHYFDNTKVGQIMSRISNDLFDITEFAHHCPEEIFICTIKIVGSFIILSRINLYLTLIIFALLPLMLVSVAFFRKGMKNAFKKQREQTGELNAQVEDTLLGIRVVKSFANEEMEEERFAEGNKRFFATKKNSYKYMARFQACTRFFDGAMYVAVIIAGSLFMVRGKINAADLIAYLLYIQTLITSIRKLVEFTEQFQRGLTGIERFNEVMCVEPGITDAADAIELNAVAGNIEYNNVSFSYEAENGEVLSHINIQVKKGENIAIVGPSGGGKTTLCNLLPRFYEIADGAITIDGLPIQEISLKSLRDHIGVVQQDVYLFSGTVRENIVYGAPDAADDAVIEAAQNAGAHEFISALPDGYDTYVGERGLKLSGGQKQRIAIARLFLKNPPILILDVATSALDNESELLVQKSLERLAKNRTTFTIAHRLTTIKNATKIIVLTENGIVEAGTHQELMEKGGEYAKLYGLYTSL